MSGTRPWFGAVSTQPAPHPPRVAPWGRDGAIPRPAYSPLALPLSCPVAPNVVLVKTHKYLYKNNSKNMACQIIKAPAHPRSFRPDWEIRCCFPTPRCDAGGARGRCWPLGPQDSQALGKRPGSVMSLAAWKSSAVWVCREVDVLISMPVGGLGAAAERGFHLSQLKPLAAFSSCPVRLHWHQFGSQPSFGPVSHTRRHQEPKDVRGL